MKKQGLTLSERYWLWNNKKHYTKGMIYAVDKIVWLGAGFLLALSFAGFVEGTCNGVIGGIILLIFAITLISVEIWFDNKNGYVDNLHRYYLERYEKRRAELIAKKEKRDVVV